MTRWTHEGKPLGQPQRPWRLTRAQRVEMEAALSRLRGDVRTVPDADGWYSSETVEVTRTLGAYTMDAVDDGVSESVFRARVAIALRAALRADEDARCEEALRRAGYGEGTGATPGDAWDTGYDSGARTSIDAAREWPAECHDDSGLVPLALWELDERRRRETVRVVEALLAVGPRDLAEETLRALADGDGVRVEQLALRLATAVLRERAETMLEEVGT